MEKPQLKSGDIEFLIENERSLLDSLIVFRSVIRSPDSKAERMKYAQKYQRAYGNLKSEKAITQRLFNRVVGINYSIKQISYIATAVRELVMRGKYQRDDISIDQKSKIAASQNYICPICGKKFDLASLEIDHKIPFEVIGEHFGDENLQTLCRRCNQNVKRSTIGLQTHFTIAMQNTR